jgi:hypothetical protein
MQCKTMSLWDLTRVTMLFQGIVPNALWSSLGMGSGGVVRDIQQQKGQCGGSTQAGCLLTPGSAFRLKLSKSTLMKF